MPDTSAPDFSAGLSALLAPFDRLDGPGLALAVRRGGRTILRSAVGMADPETGRPNGCDVPMRIASLSKQFLCTAVLILEAEGRLALDDRLVDHLPDMPAAWDRVLLRHLMSNTSGIRDFLEMRLLSGGTFDTAPTHGTALAPVTSQLALNYAPGSHFSYCNTGFHLLTLIVERIEGRPLEEVLHDRIFGPLGMTRTALCRTQADTPADMAVPHVETADGLEKGVWAVPLDGAGGVVSCVDDLLKWADNLRAPRVGNAEMFARMSRPTTFPKGGQSVYGLGLTTMDYRGRVAFGHHGQLTGTYAEIAIYPEVGAVVVLLANTSALNPFVLGRQIADLTLADALDPAPELPADCLDGRWLDPTTGQSFRISNGAMSTAMMTAPIEPLTDGSMRMMWPMSMISFRPDGDRLIMRDGDRLGEMIRLDDNASVPLPQGRWRADEGGFALTFDTDRAQIDGPLGALVLHPRAIGHTVIELHPPEDPVGRWVPHLWRDGDQLVLVTDRTHAIRFSPDT